MANECWYFVHSVRYDIQCSTYNATRAVQGRFEEVLLRHHFHCPRSRDLLVKQSSSGKRFAPLRFEVLAVGCCLWRQKSVPLNSIDALTQLLLLLSLACVCLSLALQWCGSREDESGSLFFK
jgi:hypothetical protein